MKNTLAKFKIGKKEYTIGATYHSIVRIQERHINPKTLLQSIIAIGAPTIAKFGKNNEEAIIIDKENNISIVAGFNGTEISIITVIDRANVFVKENTTVVNI